MEVLTSLDHLVIAVRDLEAATSTYTALLGRAPSWQGEHPGAGTANTLYRLDRTYVELLCPIGSGALADTLHAHLERNGEGPYAIAFGTGDAVQCSAALRARGLTATEPADGRGRDRSTAREREWRAVFIAPADTRGVLLFAVEHRSPPDALPRAVAADEGAAISGVDHAVIMTADAEASCTLYRDQLGLRLAFDRTFEARRVRLLFFRIGGVTVEIAAPVDAGDGGGPDRFWGISWRVADVDAARARLLAGGFDVSEVRLGNKVGTRVCTVRRETHGVATLLLEREKRDA